MAIEAPDRESSPITAPTYRDAAGRFTLGNPFSRKDGRSAFQQRGPEALDEAQRAEWQRFSEALLSDQGGAAACSELRLGYVRRLAELHVICDLLASDLAKRGLLTRRGRVRSTYGAFMSALDRFDRLAQRLGLERRAREVTLSELLTQAGADDGRA